MAERSGGALAHMLTHHPYFEVLEVAAAVTVYSGKKAPRVAEVRLEDCRIVPVALSAEDSRIAVRMAVAAAVDRIVPGHLVRPVDRQPSCCLG